MTFRDHSGLRGEKWDALSSCGFYALRVEPEQTVALFIPGTFAKSERIGARKTRAGAEQLCARHFGSKAFKFPTVQ